jgi:Bacterial Ig-like domain
MATDGRFLATALLTLAIAVGETSAQAPRPGGGSRRVATLIALTTFPFFFHTQPVRVRGTATEKGGLFRIDDDGAGVWLLPGPNGRLPDPGRLAEVTGVAFDVGRVERTDSQVASSFSTLSQRVVNREWPAPGELLVIVVDMAVDAAPLSAPSVRNVAIDPERYLDQEVTVVGRFRGRNLYGDLPEAPGKSRWDFILQSADAALWVTGRRPRGDGFDLNVDNRVDTGRWLEVAGVVRQERGLAHIEAASIRLAQPPAQSAAEAIVKVPITVPPPEVVFSAPTQEETDVEPTATIRIQFSRDVRPETFKGQISAAYVGAATELPPFATTYDAGRRVVEIKFAAPLEPFRTMQISLGAGITGTDGQPLKPYLLKFSVGS